MRRNLGQGGALLASVLALGGCAWVGPALTPEADAGFGAPFLLPWSTPRTVSLADSFTVRRIRGGEGVDPENLLQVDPGNVWPAEESPRATLANPDAALRGVPPWRPGEGRSTRDLPVDERPGGPLVQPRADATIPDNEQRPQRRRPNASSPPPFLSQPEPSRVDVPPPRFDPPPPPRRADGQIVVPPLGPPVVTSGGTDRVQGFVTPGGGSGVIHRDGGVTTIVPSGGMPQSFPTPLR